MPVDDHLQYEARLRPRLAVLAGAAALLLILGSAFQLVGPTTPVAELTVNMITAHKRVPLDVIAGVLNAVGLLAEAAVLVFLSRAASARQAQFHPWIRVIAPIGAVLAGASVLAYDALFTAKANQFVSSGGQTYVEANHLISSGAFTVLPQTNEGGALLLAIVFVLVSLNAMRVGLLTRFMGYLGIFAGVLVMLPLVPLPIVQVYWLGALAYLLWGRWPSGVPPAWESGRAEPWPSAQEMREQRLRQSGASSRGKPEPKPKREPVGASTPRGTRATTPKRKRKRRR